MTNTKQDKSRSPEPGTTRKFETPRMTRRTMLQSMMAATALSPGLVWADAMEKARRLVLVELSGGNDGLNTVIPFSQKRYYEARPVLAIKKDNVVRLSEHLGLHPELAPLLPTWKDNDLHIALGVGYPDPNRSHFRSSDIWHTASGSDQVLKRGWLANGFSADRDFSAEGIAFGNDYGPFLGSSQSLVLENPDKFVKQARLMRPVQAKTNNPALGHVIDVRRQIAHALTDVTAAVDARDNAKVKGSDLHKQLIIISDMIRYGARVPVYKATLKGFDTHFNQPNRHKRLMRDLGTELAGLRDRLKAAGEWDDTLVMTYSEFGRRPAENGSRGTDHGTAAPLFFMGGSIRGGFSGQQPEFPSLGDKDMDFNLDFRRIYRTVADQWLGATRATDALRDFKPIDLIRSWSRNENRRLESRLFNSRL